MVASHPVAAASPCSWVYLRGAGPSRTSAVANYCWQPAASLFVLHTLGYVVFAAFLFVQHAALVAANLTTNEAMNWRR